MQAVVDSWYPPSHSIKRSNLLWRSSQPIDEFHLLDNNRCPWCPPLETQCPYLECSTRLGNYVNQGSRYWTDIISRGCGRGRQSRGIDNIIGVTSEFNSAELLHKIKPTPQPRQKKWCATFVLLCNYSKSNWNHTCALWNYSMIFRENSVTIFSTALQVQLGIPFSQRIQVVKLVVNVTHRSNFERKG